MNSAIDRARQATATGDWATATGYLQHQLSALPKGAAAPEEALDLALQILAEGDFKARWDVAKLLPVFGLRAISPLAEIVGDEDTDPEERWFACRLLGQFDDPTAIATLMALLQETDDPDLIAIATSALAAIGPRAIAALSDLLHDPQTCSLAASALAQIPDPATVEPLLGMADATDEKVRTTAIEALGNFHDPRVTAVLQGALADLAAPVRQAAVVGLGLRMASADDSLLATVRPLLQDLDMGVCQQAALAIGRFPDEAATAVLETELTKPLTPPPLQITLVRALAWRESPTALMGLVRALPQVEDAVALEIVRVLGRIDTSDLKPKATELLLVFFQRQDTPLNADLSRTLAHTLGLLGHASSRPTLEQLAQSTDAGVRLHARNALAALPIS